MVPLDELDDEFDGFKKRRWHIPPAAYKPIAIGVLILAVIIGIFTVKACIHPVTVITSSSLKSVLVESSDLVTSYSYYSGVMKIDDYQKLQEWNIPLTRKRLLYIYQGKAVLGLDFKKINVDVAGDTIFVKCPPVSIISNSIDEDTIEIYDETKNIFNQIGADDVFGTLGEAKKQAEENMLTNGTLEGAREAAQKAIVRILELNPDVKKGKYKIVVDVPKSKKIEYLDDSSKGVSIQEYDPDKD